MNNTNLRVYNCIKDGTITSNLSNIDRHQLIYYILGRYTIKKVIYIYIFI